MEYGLQLFSVRDSAEVDLEGTLCKVAELGYKYVEFAGFYGHSASEVKGWLEKYGLKVSGAHIGMHELFSDAIDSTIAYHKELGNKNIMTAWLGFESREAFDGSIVTLNEAYKKLTAEGFALGHHNHSIEYLPTAYGANIHKELEDKTDIYFEIDTFWVYAAGLDPVAEIERLKDRTPVIHIKDGYLSEDGSTHGMPLGEGSAPVEEVYRKACELGMFMVVESETLTPSGLDEAERCIKYLRKIEENCIV